jgi:hypothetical protein
MSPRLYAHFDGKPVPLDGCDWVLWFACGCPRGVTVAVDAPTEDAAWKVFYDLKRDRDKARKSGLRMELMPHERYSREVFPRMLAGCTHAKETTR